MLYLYPVVTHCYPLPLVVTCYDPSSPVTTRCHPLPLPWVSWPTHMRIVVFLFSWTICISKFNLLSWWIKKLWNGGTFGPPARAASRALGHWPKWRSQREVEEVGVVKSVSEVPQREDANCMSELPWATVRISLAWVPLPARFSFSNRLFSASWVRF